MARQRISQSAFSNGVISPRALGRVDMDKYKHSAEILQNVMVLPQGGIKRRPGSQWVADAMGPSRLIPFVFSANQGYMLEVGNQKIRFFYADNTSGRWTVGRPIMSGGSQLTLSTPYDTSLISLWDIQYAQQGDVMYFFHTAYPTQKLLRYGTVGVVPGPSDTGWAWTQVTFTVPPMDQYDQDVSGGTITLTTDSNAGTNGFKNSVFTASAAATFLDGDNGKYIVSGIGLALITATTGFDATGTTCQATIIVPFTPSVIILAGDWQLRGSPNAAGAFGKNTAGNWTASSQFGFGASQQFWTFVQLPDNNAAIVGTQDCFRSTDVGRYINASGCISQITSVTNAHQVQATMMTVAEDTFSAAATGRIAISPAPYGAWTVEDPAWFGTNGYPGVGAFYQNRLFVGRTVAQPKTLWGSNSDNYENFGKGTHPGDSLEFTVAGGKQDTIKWLSSTPVQGLLAIETDSTEYVASGGATGAAITPTSVHIQANSAQGGSNILPILVDSSLVYVQRYHTKVFEFSFNIYQSSFSSKDLSLYAEHLSHAGIKETAYQPVPYKIIWMVTYDGRLLGMTYDRTENLLAWHEHRTGYADNGYGVVGTGDSYISVASLPNPSPELLGPNGVPVYSGNSGATYASDLVWTCVQRTRGGQTVYTIELMNENLLVDCSRLTPLSGPQVFTGSSNSITDSNLAGRVAVAYGAPVATSVKYFPFDNPLGLAALTNAFGTLPLDLTINNPDGNFRSSSLVGFGLPFKAKILTIRPEVPQMGTILGVQQGWTDFYVRVYASGTIRINGDESTNLDGWDDYGVSTPADSLEPGQLLRGQNLDQSFVNTAPTFSDELSPLTRDIRVQALGYDRFGRVLIEQDKPLPLTIVGVYGILNIGDT